MIEDPGMFQKTRMSCGSLVIAPSALQGSCLDFSAFDRIVIHRIKLSKPSFSSSRESGGFRFGLPIDPGGSEMIRPQRHVRAAVEDGAHVLLAIFAAKTQKHAASNCARIKLCKARAERRV